MKENDLLQRLVSVIGEPHNYGPTALEREELDRVAARDQETAAREATETMRVREAEEAVAHAASEALWIEKLQVVRAQDEEVMAAASMPLRNFLVNHVMPTLSQV